MVVKNWLTCVKCILFQKKYSKRSLESNWQRYEMPPEDQETQSSSTKDFSILLESSGEKPESDSSCIYLWGSQMGPL